jgi:putative SOS response-associated peptidase YedK
MEAANELVRQAHTRTAVIVEPRDYDAWLDYHNEFFSAGARTQKNSLLPRG